MKHLKKKSYDSIFSNYYLTHDINKKIDTHIFFVCKHKKRQELQKIASMMDIEKFPQKVIRDFQDESITYYTEKYKILLIGYGSEEECSQEAFYELFLRIGKVCSSIDSSIIIHLHDSKSTYIIHHQICGFITGHYTFHHLKSGVEKEKKSNKKIYFYTPKRTSAKTIRTYIQMGLIQNEVRNYMNLPSNLLRIPQYISYIKKNSPSNLSVKVLTKSALQKLGMNLLLSVSQGSNQDPALLILEYKGDKKSGKSAPVCFIGKGVMFDSGGYDLKKHGMAEMKMDMSASAITYGIMKAHASLHSPGHYVALLPLVENMIVKDAIRPGDIIRSYCGKTVEINNTDAEGRLIIADCMSYSQKYHPQLIIDIGTLTGSTAYMFANKSSVIMGNHHPYIRTLMDIGKKYHEHIWEMPLWTEYVDELKSNIADLQNVGSSHKAEAMVAGAFLSQFVPRKKDGKEVHWIHLDIAGTEMIQNSPYYQNGAKVDTLKSVYQFTKELF